MDLGIDNLTNTYNLIRQKQVTLEELQILKNTTSAVEIRPEKSSLEKLFYNQNFDVWFREVPSFEYKYNNVGEEPQTLIFNNSSALMEMEDDEWVSSFFPQNFYITAKITAVEKAKFTIYTP